MLIPNHTIAGNYGSGRRAGGVSTIICGVPNETHRDENGDPKCVLLRTYMGSLKLLTGSCVSFDPILRYSTFVRIGTGLSFADYVWVRQKPWKEWDPENPPSFLMVSNQGQDDKGDVYLEPEE